MSQCTPQNVRDATHDDDGMVVEDAGQGQVGTTLAGLHYYDEGPERRGRCKYKTELSSLLELRTCERPLRVARGTLSLSVRPHTQTIFITEFP